EVGRLAPGRHLLLERLLDALVAHVGTAATKFMEPRIGTDACVAKAIQLLHADPKRRWTVASLAKACGLSRAAFARRFAGVAPGRYLTAVRMQLAEAMLIETDASLAAIAASVGYDSEFAFGRAFKRHAGRAPGTYRRTRRATARPAAPAPARTRAAA